MSLIDILFPRYCLHCKKGSRYLCDKCLVAAGWAKQKCIECEKASIDGMTHSTCKKRTGLDGALAVWNYEGVIRKAIIKLKYGFVYDVASELALKTGQYLLHQVSALPKQAILTPVPLHSLRLRYRGFNQSAEIAKLLAGIMSWQYSDNLLVRLKAGIPQATLSEKQRKINLKGAFAVNSHKLPADNCIVFDDVWTTGTTLKEAGRVLKKSGVEKVWGLTIAK